VDTQIQTSTFKTLVMKGLSVARILHGFK